MPYMSESQADRLTAQTFVASLIRHTLSSFRGRCLYIAGALLLIVTALAGIYLLYSWLASIRGSLIEWDSGLGFPLFVYIVATVGVWPAAIAASLAVMSAGSLVAVLRFKHYPSTPSVIDEDIVLADGWRGVERVADMSIFDNLLFDAYPIGRESPGSLIKARYTCSIAGRDAAWAQAWVQGRNYNILSVDAGNLLPSSVIDSRVDGAGVLPTHFVNACEVTPEGDVYKYFSLHTAEGHETALLKIITPNVLWSLVTKLDACDTEFRGNRIVFIWPEGEWSLDALWQRAHKVEEFVAEVTRTLDDGEHAATPLILKPKRKLFDTLASVLALSGVIAITLGLSLSLWLNHPGPGTAILSFLLYIPSLCLMMTFVFAANIIRSMRDISWHVREVMRVREYLFYYRGRE